MSDKNINNNSSYNNLNKPKVGQYIHTPNYEENIAYDSHLVNEGRRAVKGNNYSFDGGIAFLGQFMK